MPYLMQVTAAHCVYDINDSHQYVANLNFAPGEADENTLPYGSVQWSSVRVLSQFTNQVRRCRAGSMSTCRALGGVQHAIGVYCTGHPPQYCSLGNLRDWLRDVVSLQCGFPRWRCSAVR